MLNFWNWFKGKKSYIVAGATVAYGLAEWWSGAMTQPEAVAFIAGGAGLGTLRHGLASTVLTVVTALNAPAAAAPDAPQK